MGSAGSAGQTFVYTCWPLWAVGTAPGARQLWGHSAGLSKLAPPHEVGGWTEGGVGTAPRVRQARVLPCWLVQVTSPV